MPKTLLIFSFECAPYNRPGSTMGAQRPYHFAKYLPNFGWRVIVICCDYNRRRSITEDQLSNVLQEQANKQYWLQNETFEIISLPSLKSADVIDRLWWKFTGTDEKSGTYFSKGNFFGIVTRKILTFIKLFRGDYSQSWQKVAMVVAEEIVKKVKINICMGEHGPDCGLYLAKWFNKKHGVPFIIDFRDPFLIGIPSSLRILYKYWVRYLLRGVQFITNVNPYWTQLDKKMLKTKCYTITNGYDESDIIYNSFKETSNEKLIISLAGSIKKDMHPEILFEGLSLYRSTSRKYLFEFKYYGNQIKLVNEYIGKYQLHSMANIFPHTSRDIFYSEIKKSDILIILSLKRSDVFFKNGFYPGKIFEYMSLNKPILNIPEDRGLLSTLIKSLGIGLDINTPNSLADLLLSIEEGSKTLKQFYNPDLNKISYYSRKNQTKMLADLLHEKL